MSNHIATHGYVIQRLIDRSKKAWESVSFALTTSEADRKIADLTRFNSGVYRAIPRQPVKVMSADSIPKPTVNLVWGNL